MFADTHEAHLTVHDDGGEAVDVEGDGLLVLELGDQAQFLGDGLLVQGCQVLDLDGALADYV